MRLVFMGTPAFALPALAALAGSAHEIVAVYTQPPRPAGRGQKETPSPVQAFAAAHGLPVFSPVSLKDAEAQAEFASHKADAAVVAAYGLLLPEAILRAPRFGCLNIHPSLLPRWRGAAPIQRTLMAGDAESGVCIMQMDAGLDTGGVLARERLAIPGDMNAGALHDALAQMGAVLLLQVLEQIPQGGMQAEAQGDAGATYAAKLGKEDCRIDWRKSAAEVHNMVRALSPAPGAVFKYNGELIKVFSTAVASGNAAPGTVLDDALTIACGSGAVRLLEVQRPGKKRMTARDMLRGLSIPPGGMVH